MVGFHQVCDTGCPGIPIDSETDFMGHIFNVDVTINGDKFLWDKWDKNEITCDINIYSG